MNPRKVIKQSGNGQLVMLIARELKVEPLVARLLVQRGINSPAEALEFFNPSLDRLHDPYMMKDMNKAAERIEQAVDKNEKILIFGDYDVDGTTGVSLFYSFLKVHYVQIAGKQPVCGYYIPDRYTEGYGVSYKGIDYAAENGYSLVIAIDCGIKAVEKINYACEKQIDFIVCDHHLPGETLPPAIAVLDPKQPYCLYPYKELTGCGIAFKLAQAITIRNGYPIEALNSFLELVSLSVAADIVPVTGENRILAFFGLKRMNENPGCGIRALMEVSGLRPPLSTGEVVFVLAPRINAAGRIDSGMKAVELLTTQDNAKANEFARLLNEDNITRKELDTRTTLEAISMIEKDDQLLKSKSTVLFNPQWHKGVIGIVASRVIEKYYRPTILLTRSNGTATGSARSVPGFDIYTAIEACSDLLEQFGGHKYAAGLTLKADNVEKFREKFETVVTGLITDELLTPCLNIDAVVSLDELSFELYSRIMQFAPFGPGNMRPVFETKRVFDSGFAREVGTGHLKMKISDLTRPAVKFDAIGFGMANRLSSIRTDAPLDIVYSLDKNVWMGYEELQLKLKDVVAAE